MNEKQKVRDIVREFLFEPNCSATWSRLAQTIKEQTGLDATFDATTTTPTDMDAGELHGWVDLGGGRRLYVDVGRSGDGGLSVTEGK